MRLFNTVSGMCIDTWCGAHTQSTASKRQVDVEVDVWGINTLRLISEDVLCNLVFEVYIVL